MDLDASIDYLSEGSSLSSAHLLVQQAVALCELGAAHASSSTLWKSACQCEEAIKIDPLFANAWHAWAQVLLKLAKISGQKEHLWDAKIKIEKALTLSDSPLFHWDAGVIYQELAAFSEEPCDLTKAIAHFEKSAHETLSKEQWICVGKAYADLAEKLCDLRLLFKSVEAFKKGTPLTQGWALLSQSLRAIFLMTHEEKLFQQSYDCQTVAVELEPHNFEYKLDRIELLIEMGRIKNDLSKLREAISQCAALSGENPYLLSYWAEALALLGEKEGNVEFLHLAEQKICRALELTSEEDPAVLTQCGKCLYSMATYFFDLDLYYQAVETLQASLSLDRTQAEGWAWMGKTYITLSAIIEEEGTLSKALRFYQKALHLKPDHSYYFEIAFLLIQQDELGSVQKGLEYFNYLLQSYPLVYHDSPRWFFEQGMALDRLGFLQEDPGFYYQALRSFAHVLLREPKYPSVYHRIALVYSHLADDLEKSEDFSRSLHYFELAHMHAKEDEALHIDWGSTWMLFSEYATDTKMEQTCLNEAEKKFLHAAKLGSLDVYYPLAGLYCAKENFELAIDCLRKAHFANTLPSLEEIQEDDWFETIRLHPSFQELLALLQKK